MKKEERDFIDACRFGFTGEAAELLNAGVDMDIRDSDGWAPLHIVCLHGYTPIVRLLLEAGADVNAKNEEDESPLDMVVGRLHYDPIREEVLDLFRELHPDLVMEAYCAMEVKS